MGSDKRPQATRHLCFSFVSFCHDAKGEMTMEIQIGYKLPD